MTIAANIGDVAILNFEAFFPDSVVGFLPCERLAKDYFFYLLRSMKVQFVKAAPVTSQGNLNIERVGTMSIPLPPVSEQEQIASHLMEKTRSFESGIKVAQGEIDLIREYRTRLIADVVTGQVDVRHLAPAPEAVEVEVEPEDLDDEMPGDDEAGLSEEVIDADD